MKYEYLIEWRESTVAFPDGHFLALYLHLTFQRGFLANFEVPSLVLSAHLCDDSVHSAGSATTDMRLNRTFIGKEVRTNRAVEEEDDERETG